MSEANPSIRVETPCDPADEVSPAELFYLWTGSHMGQSKMPFLLCDVKNSPDGIFRSAL